MTLVFLRPRPLATSEQGDAPVTYVHEPVDAAVVVHAPAAASSSSSTKRYKPFTGVLSPDNDAAYALAVRPLVADVVAGATACCFAYGHTNSGKTHTIFGYGADRGMYQRAAEELFTQLREGLLVQVRFYELYNGKVLDLLDDRRAGFVREDADGTIHVRSETTMGPNGEVRTQSLRACYFGAAAELIALVRASASARAAGTSELHAQSSRSHAILELEVVTHELARAREAVVEAQARVVPVGKARDDLYIAIQSKLYQRQDDGTYVVVGQASPEESEQLARLEAQVRVAEDEVCAAQARVAAAMAAGGDAVIGGKLVFVDLAGAEYTGQGLERNPKELREAKEINASLLALKECVRARASGGHTPYRNSKLTMLLRDHLEPKRAGRTVMIANVSSSAVQSAKAANTIRYAALVADAFRAAQ